MPRARRHPLTVAVRRALPRPLSRDSRRFLDLLDRRLAALAGQRPLPVSPAERGLARRFLAPRAALWDDGDENLVRGHLDRWHASDAAATRRALLDAATSLSAIAARPATLWFFLWEMESLLAGLQQEQRPGGRRG